MGYLSKRATSALLVVICVGCSPAPSSICAMPQNRHFWQGVEVAWSGEVIDVAAPPHGGGIYFTDHRCGGVSIELDRDIIPKLYSASEDWSGHVAVAEFEVRGRLSYKDGKIVLRPEKLTQTSPWLIDEGFEGYMEKWRASFRGKGLAHDPSAMSASHPKAAHSEAALNSVQADAAEL